MLRYCDGASLMGDLDEPVGFNNQTIYFRGRRILDAQLHALLNERGMDRATDVIFGGSSAGGLAVYLNCDRFALAVSVATEGSARTVCLPDSGYFVAEVENVRSSIQGA